MSVVTDIGLAAPFLGLRYFDEEHSHVFFGRDLQINDVLEKLRRSRLVTVMGSSGSGKSSLVRAGVIPRLKAGHLGEAGPRWRIAKMRPGSSPIVSLARELEKALSAQGLEVTLRRGPLGLVQAVEECRLAPTENVLVIADQFEEVFRYQREASQPERAKEEAAAFVKLLLEATGQRTRAIYVIVTMRSDYLGNCAQFRDLPERINEGLYLVPRMRRDQLEEAIAGPVAVEDAEITPRLLQKLLNETGDDPDQLPVLQHALLRAWNAWNYAPRPLDLQDFDVVGGMKDGLSRHADEIFTGLSINQQRIARVVFQQLSERDAEGREIRRPAPVARVAAVAGVTAQAVEEVAARFAVPEAALLYRNEDGDLDITHESLIRKWRQMQGTRQDGIQSKGWIQEEVDSRDQFLLLAERAAKQDTLMGRALEDSIRWRDLGLNADWARRYTKTDGTEGAYQDVLRFIEESRKKDDARRYRRRLLIIVLVTGVLVALGLISFFWLQANRQAEAARIAEREAKQQAEAATVARDDARRQAEAARTAEGEAKRQTQLADDAASDAERQAMAALIQLGLGGGDFVELARIAGETPEPWHRLPVQLTREFLERIEIGLLGEKPWRSGPWNTAASNGLLDVIERGHRLLVPSPRLFGEMSFALEEVWLRSSPTSAVRQRAATLFETVRAAFIEYHRKETPGFQAPPASPGQDALNPLVRVRGGEFTMGEKGVVDSEPHLVKVSDFSMQQHEVTNEEYGRFDPTHGFPAGGKRHPVVNVSWYESVGYAAWLGASLPTEAQWEYAAWGTGATKGRLYPWGNEPPLTDNERAVYKPGGGTDPVGSHPTGRTPEGLDDMGGSVSEWCRDVFRPYKPGDDLNPLGPSPAEVERPLRRAFRGGNFGDAGAWRRDGARNKYPPGLRFDYIGFRLASSRLHP